MTAPSRGPRELEEHKAFVAKLARRMTEVVATLQRNGYSTSNSDHYANEIEHVITEAREYLRGLATHARLRKSVPAERQRKTTEATE